MALEWSWYCRKPRQARGLECNYAPRTEFHLGIQPSNRTSTFRDFFRELFFSCDVLRLCVILGENSVICIWASLFRLYFTQWRVLGTERMWTKSSWWAKFGWFVYDWWYCGENAWWKDTKINFSHSGSRCSEASNGPILINAREVDCNMITTRKSVY